MPCSSYSCSYDDVGKKPKKKKRPRTLRRKVEREHAKEIADRLTLAMLEPGGRPERPLEVPTAAVVETRAEALGCPRCLSPSRARSHDATTVDGVSLRHVVTRCTECEHEREVWVRIVVQAPN